MQEKELKLIIKEELERMGFVLWFAPHYANMRWDVFTIFDIVAIHKSNPTSAEVNFIQFTTASHVSHRRRKMCQWMLDNDAFIPNSWLYCYDTVKKTFKVHRITMDEVLKYSHEKTSGKGEQQI